MRRPSIADITPGLADDVGSMIADSASVSWLDKQSDPGPLSPPNVSKSVKDVPNPVLVIHGGAGNLNPNNYTKDLLEDYRNGLRIALHAGYEVLRDSGNALDAVEAAIRKMEDSPLFNAGKGAVFNSAGENELEASVMVTDSAAAGVYLECRDDFNEKNKFRGAATTLLKHVRNPITLSKRYFLATLNESVPGPYHVLLSGPNAEEIAKNLGCDIVDQKYFHTEARWKQHLDSGKGDIRDCNSSMGTVGAVALDANGKIAVGTSTGGLTNKLPGRIGDTPSMGAGFWAEEWEVEPPSPSFFKRIWNKLFSKTKMPRVKRAVGVSGTGNGDYFIRNATCHDLISRVKYKGEPIAIAANAVLAKLNASGAEGGVIALDEKGSVTMEMNCGGMFRGWIDIKEAKARVAIFKGDRVT